MLVALAVTGAPALAPAGENRLVFRYKVMEGLGAGTGGASPNQAPTGQICLPLTYDFSEPFTGAVFIADADDAAADLTITVNGDDLPDGGVWTDPNPDDPSGLTLTRTPGANALTASGFAEAYGLDLTIEISDGQESVTLAHAMRPRGVMGFDFLDRAPRLIDSGWEVVTLQGESFGGAITIGDEDHAARDPGMPPTGAYQTEIRDCILLTVRGTFTPQDTGIPVDLGSTSLAPGGTWTAAEGGLVVTRSSAGYTLTASGTATTIGDYELFLDLDDRTGNVVNGDITPVPIEVKFPG